MIVTLILLNSGEYLIGQAEQLEYEPSCHLREPYHVTGMTPFKLTSWPKYTDEEDILLYSTSIQTMCEPTEKLLTQYLTKVGKTLKEIQTVGQKLLVEEQDDYEDRDFPVDENNEVIYESDVMYIEE